MRGSSRSSSQRYGSSGVGSAAWWKKQTLHHQVNFANWAYYIDTAKGRHPSLDHFLEGGLWGWPIAFFPCVLLYPLVTRVPAVPFYGAVALLLPPVFFHFIMVLVGDGPMRSSIAPR